MLPLSRITVVALEHAVAAPFATRQLADLGARVIKVERPLAGDFARSYDGTVRGMSSHFVWLNRSKESMTLDLKAPQARDVMVRLVDRADVFVQNLAPGAAERLGLSAERLRKDHPRLIVCDISGYGPDGPYCEKKAYDLLIQSEAGLLSITGTEEAPSKAGISIADISAGMYAFTGILTELYRREKTGEGGHVEVSMLEANEREWAAFCEQVLMRPELACDPRFDTNPRRVANREALEEAIREIFDGMTAGEVASRLDRAQIANSRMNSMEDVWRHPQFTARRRWREVDSPVGALPMLLPPCNHGGFVARMDPIPALGEHTEKVLAELGFLEDAVQRLRADGVV